MTDLPPLPETEQMNAPESRLIETTVDWSFTSRLPAASITSTRSVDVETPSESMSVGSKDEAVPTPAPGTAPATARERRGPP